MSEPLFGVDFGKDGTTYIVPAPGPITAACIEAAYQSAVADFGVDHSHDLDAWALSILKPHMTPEDIDEVLNREYGPPGPTIVSPQLLARYEAFLQSESLAEALGDVPPGITVDDRRKRPS